MTEELQESGFYSEHYQALGKIVIHFQSIETSIDRLLLAFMGQTPISDSLTSDACQKIIMSSSFNNKLEVLSSVLVDIPKFSATSVFKIDSPRLEAKFHGECEQLKNTLKEARECQTIRNQLVHSNWIDGGIGVKGDSVHRFKLKVKSNGVKVTTEDWSVEDAGAQADRFENIANALTKQSVLFMSIVKQ